MKRSKCLLFILLTIILFWHNGSQASETPVWERLVNIELKDQDLSQALEAVTGQLGINLSFHGKKPKAKRDISLSQIPMGEAVSRIMRLYRVQNHAAAYNPESKTLLLAVLGSVNISEALPSGIFTGQLFDENMRRMTQDDFALLESESSENMKGMNQDEYTHIESQSYEDMKGMSPEELALLQPTSPSHFKGMTRKEYSRLIKSF